MELIGLVALIVVLTFASGEGSEEGSNVTVNCLLSTCEASAINKDGEDGQE